jgi:hypothetical protein
MADIATEPPSIDVSADRETLYRDGIVALKQVTTSCTTSW